MAEAVMKGRWRMRDLMAPLLKPVPPVSADTVQEDEKAMQRDDNAAACDALLDEINAVLPPDLRIDQRLHR